MKVTVKVLIFVAIMLTAHFMAQTPAITSDFDKKAAQFYVLGKNKDGYQTLSLNTALSNSSAFNFHLSKVKIRLNGRKKHTIEILENTGSRQRVRYLYSGTAKT